MAFKAFKGVIASGGVVRAIQATGAAAQPRSFFDKLNDWARSEGAPGLGYVVFEEENGQLTGKGPIAKFIPAEVQALIAERAGAKAGDAVFFSAGVEGKAAGLAGKARIRGVEFEGNARLFGNPGGSRVNFAWSLGYLDGKFKEFLTFVAIDRETGARGLRSIIEEVLLEVQFELPSRRDVKKCVVTKETVEQGLRPTLVTAAADEDEGEQAAESA